MTGKQFKKIREELGMDQNQLARTLKTTATSVYRWEAGSRRIYGPVAVLMKLLLEKHKHQKEAKSHE